MSTNPDWERVRVLFQTALEQPADRRDLFLSTACPDDARVRDEVRSLLAAHGAAGTFLETPAARIEEPFADAASLTLKPGDQLGVFEIVGLLGAGGMGEVYHARDRALGRDVAIKVLPPAFAEDPERLARFERESRVLASLNHPNIATIHSVEHVNGLHLLVLELVEGVTLAERLSGGALPVQIALTIGRQLATALEAAHERGIVHRDLKPSNVKLSPAAHVKLLDFGLAKAREPEDVALPTPRGATHTIAGVILGTSGYMSPEQARGQPVDKRADIWAFGCLLFELLCGRPAFSGQTASDTIAAVLERQPEWTALPPETPVGIRRLLRRCLVKDPAERLHDIADARIEIDDALEGTTEFEPPRTATGLRAYLGAIVPILVFAIGGGVVAWWARATPTPRPVSMPLTHVVWSLPADLRLESPPAVSPDGRAIAFTASVAGGPPRLFVRSMSELDAQPISRTEGAKQPFWSPDSRTIAYFARGALMKVAIDGGAPVEVCAAPDARGGTWGTGGVIVFAPASIFAGLQRVPAAGGRPEPATLIDSAQGENAHRWPAFLPDGIHYLYFVRSVVTERRGVYIARIDRPAALPGAPLFRSEGEAVYAPLEDGRGGLLSGGGGTIDFRPFNARTLTLAGDPIQLPFAAGGNTPRQASMFSVSAGMLAHVGSPLPFVQRLAWTNRTGGELQIEQKQDLVSWPRVSPDGTRVVMQRLDSVTGSPDLWVQDRHRQTLHRVTRPGSSGQFPVWSPDGSQLAYVAGPVQQPMLTIAAADGTGGLRTLPCPRFRCEPTDWSSDGRWLVVNALESGVADVWMIPIREGDEPRALLTGAFVERDARMSPDGRFVAYVSDETGSPEISVQTIDGMARREVASAGGGSQPVWGRDGRELFFVNPRGLLCRTAVTRTPTGRPAVGRAEPLTVPPFGTGHYGTQFDLSPDGVIYFLDRRIDDPPRDVGIVLGWQGLVPAR